MTENLPHLLCCVGSYQRESDCNSLCCLADGGIATSDTGIDRLTRGIDQLHHASDSDVEAEGLDREGDICKCLVGHFTKFDAPLAWIDSDRTRHVLSDTPSATEELD